MIHKLGGLLQLSSYSHSELLEMLTGTTGKCLKLWSPDK